jgi:hypothetical protein
MRTLKKFFGVAAAAGVLSLTACDDFLTVPDPTVMAKSAQQNFARAYGLLITYSSWFTGETDVSETFPTRNEFGRRDIAIQNTSLNGDVWFPLSQSVASAYLVIDADLPNPASRATPTMRGRTSSSASRTC